VRSPLNGHKSLSPLKYGAWRESSGAVATVQLSPPTNKTVLPVQIDVTQEQSVVDALAETERNFGKLHIACNNAGVPMHDTELIIFYSHSIVPS
jgi:NAD(P)-dependent dehydrogenase (short-subunit alcohol dehydrogenase family)